MVPWVGIQFRKQLSNQNWFCITLFGNCTLENIAWPTQLIRCKIKTSDNLVTDFLWHFEPNMCISNAFSLVHNFVWVFCSRLTIVIALALVFWCSNENYFFLYFNCACWFLVRKLSQDEYFKTGKELELRGSHIHICSKNNFPTAAGLASSAAGYSCLGMLADNLLFVCMAWFLIAVIMLQIASNLIFCRKSRK